DGLPNTINMTMLRSALGAFLFTNEDIDKPVSVLSGGEKNKLALAKLLLRAPNLLLLDEPTNHLDLDSREALEQALIDYPGTIVVISHDRWFIDKVCNKIATIEHGVIDIFDGTYTEHEAFVALQNAQTESSSVDNETQNGKKKKRIEAAQQREAVKKATKHLSERVKKLEGQTASLEQKIAEMDAELALPETYKNSTRIKELSIAKSTAEKELEEVMEDWMMAQEELDEAMKAFE
ncbi:MAG: ABC-F family ATP-binding cassette domain-containing protein, partial [Proteobacteria bacterium]|nr:ABC-F family ATP-binding cassette domain-containing protein [Pseudomonadota bacterium]